MSETQTKNLEPTVLETPDMIPSWARKVTTPTPKLPLAWTFTGRRAG